MSAASRRYRWGWVQIEGVAHDYFRQGTTALFAALDVATGEVVGQCKTRRRRQGCLTFLQYLDHRVPEEQDVYLAIDNYITYRHSKVRTWLAQRPRYHAHDTPPYSS